MNTIITIGRQYGSGGRFVGKLIAEHYGIKFWDNELLDRVAAESGYAREILEKQDEKPTNSFLFSLAMDSYSFGYHTPGLLEMPLSQKIFLAQYEVIRDIAREGPAVFVGRCTDLALEEFDNVINIFIHASDDFKWKRMQAHPQSYPVFESREQAMELCRKKDKQRQSYYNYYSDKKWGRADTYNMTFDTSILGINGTARVIISAIDAFEEVNSIRKQKGVYRLDQDK
jgi:cytidylate kinase